MTTPARDGRLLRENPFFVLELPPGAPRAECERAGQRLLAELEISPERACSYDTPVGPATRDAALVRASLAELRDPNRRIVHELLAAWAAGVERSEPVPPWPEAHAALGWRGPWRRP